MKLLTILIFTLFTVLFTDRENRAEVAFPSFSQNDMNGHTIDNSVFTGKSNLAVISFLGCPASMNLLKDLQYMERSGRGKNNNVIIFMENTPEQIRLFNSDEKNVWSDIRKQYQLAPLTFTILPECIEDRSTVVNGKLIVATQCRGIAKKLKTNASPTMVFVNKKGEITEVVNGYFDEKNQDTRVDELLSYF